MLQIRKENRIALETIKQNLDVEKNRETILKNLNRLKEIGTKITLKEHMLAIKLTAEKLKESGVRRIQDEKKRIADATDVTRIMNKRAEATKRVIVGEAKLRAEAKYGIQTNKLSTNLVALYNKELANGARLTSEQTEFLRRYNAEMKKTGKIAQETAMETKFSFKEMFAIDRLKTGIKWFIQLRLLWGAWRSLGTAIKGVIDFEVQLSRALRTAQSETKDLIEITKLYKKAMEDAGRLHGVDFKTSGEVLYQLASAGLSAEEALAGLNTTLSLIVGTEGDATSTTKAIAGLYNVFGETLDATATKMEKFETIGDTLAMIWQNHQVEIGELQEGYSRVGAVAKIAGLSFQDVGALLGVANDNMIKGGKAGRALVSVLSRIVRDTDEFADAFQISIDPHAPLDFMKILGDIHERFKGVANTTDALGDIFSRLGLRGAPVFATFLAQYEKIIVASGELTHATGKNAEIEAKRLANLNAQIDKWRQRLIIYADSLNMAFKILSKWLEDLGKAFDEFGKKVDKAIEKDPFSNILQATDEELGLMIKKIIAEGKLGFLSMWGFNTTEAKKSLETIYKKIKELRARREGKGYFDDISEDYEATPGEDPKKKIIETEAKRKALRTYIKDTQAARLRFLDIEIGKQKIITKQQYDAAKGAEKRGEGATQAWERLEKSATTLNQLNEERKGILKDIETATKKETVDTLNQLKDQENILVTISKLELDRIKVGGITTEEYEKARQKVDDTYQAQLRLNQITYDTEIRDKGEAALKNAEQQLTLANEAAKRERDNEYALVNRIALQTKLNKIIAEYSKLVGDSQQATEIAKINNATKLEINQLQRNTLDLEKQSLETQLETTLNEENSIERNRQIARLRRDIQKIDLGIIKNQEEYNRRLSITYDWMARLKDNLKEWHDVATESLVQFTEGFAQGMGTLFSDLTGGFQAQQQEVAELEVAYGGLGKELEEAISEGDIERVNQLKGEMMAMRSEIEDLEDPIENLKDGFKDFFKSLIDGIREAIAQWIAMKIVMGVLGSFGSGGATSASEFGGTGWVIYLKDMLLEEFFLV